MFSLYFEETKKTIKQKRMLLHGILYLKNVQLVFLHGEESKEENSL